MAPLPQARNTLPTRRNILAMAALRESLYPAAPGRFSGAAYVFVWGVWLLLVATRLSLTAKYANSNIVLTLVDGKARYEPLRPDKVVTVWVNDTVDYFRIYPDTSPLYLNSQGLCS